jgi:hypothetical protein
LRYFGLPPLDQIPLSQRKITGSTLREHARQFARLLQLDLKFDKKLKEFAISVRDHNPRFANNPGKESNNRPDAVLTPIRGTASV